MTVFDPVQYKAIERQVYSMTAPSYEKYGSRAFEAYAEPLLESTGLKRGQYVLDVACGTGIPSLTIANLVAPDGSVIGIDLAPGMVELARKKAEERGLKNVTFQEADGEALPFPDESFDVVICNHGLVHMTDRTKALNEMKRVLKKTTGLLALSVWSTPDRALTIGIVAGTIRELWPAAVVPGAPLWFDYGPEGILEKTLFDMDLRDIRVTRFRAALEVTTPEEYWEGVVGISGRLQMLLKNIPEDIASQIRLKVIRTAERFRGPDQLIKIPCEEVIAVSSR